MKENTTQSNLNKPISTRTPPLGILLGFMVLLLISACTSPEPTSIPDHFYYVDGALGSDSNPGSQTQPWRSIQKAADTVVAGDTVMVLPGNYPERAKVTQVGITFKTQGLVTIQGMAILADNTTLDGFYILNSTDTEGGVEIKSNSNIVKNNKVEGATMVGILIQGNNNVVESNEIWGTLQRGTETWRDADGIRFFRDGNVIRGNYIHDISSVDNPTAHIDCFQTWNDAVRGRATNTLIQNNVCDLTPDGYIHSGGGNLSNTGGLVIRDNLVIGNHGFFVWSSDAEIVNNTFIGYVNPNQITDSARTIALYSDYSTVVFQNNIVYNFYKHVVRVGGEVKGSSNIVYRSDGVPIVNDSAYDNSKDLWGVDPLFVNPAAGDFHLQSNSPACTGSLNGGYVGAFPCSGGVLPTVTSAPTSTAMLTPPTNVELSPLPGLTWEAEQGEITTPFAVENGVVSQNTFTDKPADGGRALYRFSIQDAGDYTVKAIVNAADAGSNSFFVGMDNDPDASMIWDVTLTDGLEERTVSWREGVSPDDNASTAKIFNLTTGEHILIIRGREAGTMLDKVEVAKVAFIQPTSEATPVEATTQIPTHIPALTVTSTVVASSLSTPTLISEQTVVTNGIYVSPDGSDANPGTLEQPYKTINKAASVATAGDTIYVRGGVYVESVSVNNSGIAADPIRLMAYPGETPIIDGQNKLGANYGYLLRLYGNYIEVSGFEIRNSAGMCVKLNGQHDRVSDLKVHHCHNNGILISGNYGVVENNTVWQASQVNLNGVNGYGSSGISAGRYPDGAIIRDNFVYDNWGEGVSTFEATNTLIEGNEIRDNWSANLYISDSTGVVARDNVIYTTPDSPVQSGSRAGILMGDERCSPCSANNTVVGNRVTGAYRNLYIGYSVNPESTDGLTFTGNTFSESKLNTGVQINSYQPNEYTNFTFEGNTIIQTDGLPPILDQAGITDVGLNTIITQVQAPTLTPTAIPTLTETHTPTAVTTVSSTPIPTFTAQPIDTTPPVITNVSNLANTQLLITFSEDVGATGWDITNYRLNRASGDVVTIDSINYDGNSHITTLNINGGNALPPDNYIITVIGTTSIKDLVGNRLDGNVDGIGGDDFVHSFSVQPPTQEPPTASLTPVWPTSITTSIPPTATATNQSGSTSPLPGLSWEAECGEISAPFLVSNGMVYQSEASDLVNSGRAEYRFSVQVSGEYIIVARVNAANLGANSFYVNIDSEPTELMIWDIFPTNGSEGRYVSWRGAGGPEVYPGPQVFNLSTGNHTLVIRGREPNTQLDALEIVRVDTPSTPTESPAPILPTPTATWFLPTITAASTATPVLPSSTPTVTPVPPSPTPTVTVAPPSPTAEPTHQASVETVYDDKDSAITYTGWWSTVGKFRAYKSSFRQTTELGATAALNFTGESFSLLYKSGPGYGTLDVFVDGARVGSIDQKESPPVYQRRWDYPGRLSPGPHALKLVLVTPGATGSLDAVIVR